MQGGECGKQTHWLYGCRAAAQAWEEHYSALLKGQGFDRPRPVPAVASVRRAHDLLGVVHGGDFVFVWLDEDLDFALKALHDRYDLKNPDRLGRGAGYATNVNMLGRVAGISDDRVT